jgi:hypothetical protein
MVRISICQNFPNSFSFEIYSSKIAKTAKIQVRPMGQETRVYGILIV